MKKHVLHALEYFDVFEYPPTFAEIHLFLAVTTTKKLLQEELKNLIKKRMIYSFDDRYALNKGIFLAYQARYDHSVIKFKQAQSLLSKFQIIPTVHMVGISGSLSMLNNKKTDDIDLFVVTSENAVWISRFFILLIKKVAGIFDPNYHDLCLNLIFSESQLTVPLYKQNEYVAHEVLQLKPIFDKYKSHKDFLSANNWIVQFFPQAKRLLNHSKSHSSTKVSKIMTFMFEPLLRSLQEWWLSKKSIKFQADRGQLWLIQNDVQKRVEKQIDLHELE
ncbi:MAG: hypothetical protein ACEQSA_02730 [Weeksellaceae bacterium]